MLNIASAVLAPNRLCFTDDKFSVNRRNSAYNNTRRSHTAKFYVKSTIIMGKLITIIIKCDMCGNIWYAKSKYVKPKTFPKCRSHYSDTPRRKK